MERFFWRISILMPTEGYLNKDDKSISLSKGMAFSNERSLIFNFLELYGQLDQKIYLKNTFYDILCKS